MGKGQYLDFLNVCIIVARCLYNFQIGCNQKVSEVLAKKISNALVSPIPTFYVAWSSLQNQNKKEPHSNIKMYKQRLVLTLPTHWCICSANASKKSSSCGFLYMHLEAPAS